MFFPRVRWTRAGGRENLALNRPRHGLMFNASPKVRWVSEKGRVMGELKEFPRDRWVRYGGRCSSAVLKSEFGGKRSCLMDLGIKIKDWL